MPLPGTQGSRYPGTRVTSRSETSCVMYELGIPTSYLSSRRMVTNINTNTNSNTPVARRQVRCPLPLRKPNQAWWALSRSTPPFSHQRRASSHAVGNDFHLKESLCTRSLNCCQRTTSVSCCYGALATCSTANQHMPLL